MAADCPHEIAYVLKGFPRLSETFIANEIQLLESMGIKLRLYSVLPGEFSKVSAVVKKIHAPVTYLPGVTSLSGSGLVAWLYRNLRPFAARHLFLLRRRPLAYCASLAAMVGMSWQYRRAASWRPRKVFVKEFLQAGDIAARVLEAGTVRHLHGHFCHGATTITWFVSRLTGLPFSFTAHAKDLYTAELNPRNLLLRKMMAARFVATCTLANRRYLTQICPECSDVYTVYHGLDTDEFAPSSAAPPDGVPLILSVGRMVEKKGFDFLISACAGLKADGLHFRCLLVGPDGNHSAYLRRTIDALQVGDVVTMQSAVTQDELRSIYRRATVFVLPCLQLASGDRDGIPNVLAESMAMGVPVISTRISGIPELIENNVDGLLVPERDADSLAAALRTLLGCPALRRRLSESARRTVCERFDSRRTTLQLRDLFLAALQKAGGTT